MSLMMFATSITVVLLSFTAGYFLMSNFTVTMLHIVPPMSLLLCFSYVRDFFVKKQRLPGKIGDGICVLYTFYLALSTGNLLNSWYKTGMLPNTLGMSSFGTSFLYVLFGIVVTIILFLVVSKLENLYDRKKWKKEKENARLQEAKYGENSYT